MIKGNEKLNIADSVEFWIGFVLGAVSGMASLTIVIILLLKLTN